MLLVEAGIKFLCLHVFIIIIFVDRSNFRELISSLPHSLKIFVILFWQVAGVD